jgi:hypothetical protein
MIRKMPIPGLDPGMEAGFPKRSCSNKMLQHQSIQSEASGRVTVMAASRTMASSFLRRAAARGSAHEAVPTPAAA